MDCSISAIRKRQSMTDLILGQMDAFNIDQYRNDFNMDPLPYCAPPTMSRIDRASPRSAMWKVFTSGGMPFRARIPK